VAADTLDVLSMAEALQALSLSDNSTSFTEQLQRKITSISRKFDRRCGPIVQRSVTEWISPLYTTSEIRVASTPIASITSIVEWAGGTGTTITAADEDTSPTNGYLLIGQNHNQAILRRYGAGAGYWYVGDRTVVVTYVAGRYATTAAVDARFKDAAEEVLRAEWAVASPSYRRSSNFDEAFAVTYANSEAMISELLTDDLVLPGIG
jgi:hypothetical protein